MTITELIDKLEKAREKYGDITVARLNEEYGEDNCYTITKVVYRQNSILDDGDSPIRTYVYLK